MFHAAKFVLAGAMLAAVTATAFAEGTPATGAYGYPYPPMAANGPFGNPQAAVGLHKAMFEQQQQAFETQRQYAEEMAKRFAPQGVAATPEEARAQAKAEREAMVKHMDEARKQAQAQADQFRDGMRMNAPVPAAYPFSNETRPFAPAFDRPDFAQAKAQHEEMRKQMAVRHAEMVKRADEQRKAAEEQHAAMRKEMESARPSRKI